MKLAKLRSFGSKTHGFHRKINENIGKSSTNDGCSSVTCSFTSNLIGGPQAS